MLKMKTRRIRDLSLIEFFIVRAAAINLKIVLTLQNKVPYIVAYFLFKMCSRTA